MSMQARSAQRKSKRETVARSETLATTFPFFFLCLASQRKMEEEITFPTISWPFSLCVQGQGEASMCERWKTSKELFLFFSFSRILCLFILCAGSGMKKKKKRETKFLVFRLAPLLSHTLRHAAGVRYLRSHKVMARESETYQRFLSWHSHCDPFFFSLHFLESRPTLRVRTYLWIQRKWIENKNEEIVARLAAQRASLRAQSDCHNFPFSLISSFSFLFPTGQQMDKEWMPVGEKKEKKKRWGKGLPLYFLFWTAQSKFLFLFFYYLRSGRSKRKENIKWQCACAYTFLCHPPNFFSLFFVLAGGQEV